MGKFLQSDSKFSLCVKQIMFFTLVNIQFLLCAIPVVTLGLSASAMFHCLNRYAATHDSDAWKEFLPAIKSSWRQALPGGLIFLATGTVLAVSLYSIFTVELPAMPFFIAFVGALTFVWFAAALFYFPLVAQFENTVRAHLVNACVIGIRHFPSTLLLLVITLAALLLCSSSWYLLPVWSFIGFALVAYCMNRIIHGILVRYGAPEYQKDVPETMGD